MDRLERAIRRYRQIAPHAVHGTSLRLPVVRVWLTEDVCPALEDCIARPTFREAASWPIRTLRPGAKTPERKLIDEIDEQLCACGIALLQLANGKLINRKLAELYPPRMTIVSGSIDISDAGERCTSGCRERRDELKLELRSVRAIAGRDWKDLVNELDYFEPQQEWAQGPGGECIQVADWIVSANPELLPIGSFVVRCMLKRVETRMDTLRSFRTKCLTALRQLPGKYSNQHAAVEAGWKKLLHSVDELDDLLRTGEKTQQRDACAVLTQTYMAFHPRPNVDWLGLNSAVVEEAPDTIRSRLTQRSGLQMLDRIATALTELRGMFPEGERQTAIAEAIASGGLVIVEENGEVYWDRKLVAAQLGRTQWQLLLALAKKARQHSAVGIRDLYAGNKTVSNSTLGTTIGRLKRNLPGSLRKHIIPGPESRSYRLDLESQRIHLFKRSEER